MDNNIFQEDFSPTEISVYLPGTGPRNVSTERNHHKLPSIYDIQADEENVCVSSDTGDVYFYETGDDILELIWSVNLGEGRLQICLSNRRVFVATSKCKQGHLYVLSRYRGIVMMMGRVLTRNPFRVKIRKKGQFSEAIYILFCFLL